MPTMVLWLVALLAPVLVFSVTQRFAPRYVGAATGLVIGLVLLRLLQAFVFLMMLSRLVLLSGKIHDVFGVYFFPSRVLRTVTGSGARHALDMEQWSPQNLLVSALIWGVLGCVVGHVIDRLRMKELSSSITTADADVPPGDNAD
jgi:hypothetical protein